MQCGVHFADVKQRVAKFLHGCPNPTLPVPNLRTPAGSSRPARQTARSRPGIAPSQRRTHGIHDHSRLTRTNRTRNPTTSPTNPQRPPEYRSHRPPLQNHNPSATDPGQRLQTLPTHRPHVPQTSQDRANHRRSRSEHPRYRRPHQRSVALPSTRSLQRPPQRTRSFLFLPLMSRLSPPLTKGHQFRIGELTRGPTGTSSRIWIYGK
jgi:hypothetical protein